MNSLKLISELKEKRAIVYQKYKDFCHEISRDCTFGVNALTSFGSS